VKKSNIASLGKRASAYFIDDIVVSLFLLIIFYNQLYTIYIDFQSTMDLTPMIDFLGKNTIVFLLLRVIYQTFFIWQNSGMTLGKRLVKIRVIEIDSGDTPSFQVAFLRSALRVISDSILYLGYIFAYFNPLVQTFHDKLAKTIVVDV
jgi:uncharacterized RDD family membrane protein YckC